MALMAGAVAGSAALGAGVKLAWFWEGVVCIEGCIRPAVADVLRQPRDGLAVL